MRSKKSQKSRPAEHSHPVDFRNDDAGRGQDDQLNRDFWNWDTNRTCRLDVVRFRDHSGRHLAQTEFSEDEFAKVLLRLESLPCGSLVNSIVAEF
jgi:hypothetical protein